ncbi:MAG: GNAT family N-acetyltransferase [Flavobacteriales bacterium]|jgi:diamine N-acetyltransferase|nr:GNAT family N-acetyltransferase [Flavobacteriales bacterium]MDO7583139.1 GNAT family N-acetyltransferase [Schleiferiaceae bacterium]NCG14397.1 GNAT family N-acetyltransferase [Bacteroidota bacterium]MBT3573027.1 GNAT family N-acetyltransferase [Flavobacteriales bacterium]MBT3678366.1 GNAT family N-acetyltransferase [Flavobacteriales bacterium]|tara:strand:- start:6635 stop:7165 length:531 start_codon:yes stop_codon:yes gene_type:complete
MAMVDFDVRLRALEPSDLDQLLQWENNPEHWKAGPRYAPFSKAMMQAYLDAAKRDFWEVGQLRWMIEDAAYSPLGLVDIYDASPLHQHASVGLLVDPALRGRGIAPAALKAVQAWATEHALLRTLKAEMLTINHAARSAFTSANFKEVGTMQQWYHMSDGWQDMVIMQWQRPKRQS